MKPAVIAGSYWQYKMWLDRYNLKAKDFYYISDADRAHGMEIGLTCYLVGTYWLSPVWNSVILKSRMFNYRKEDEICQK